MGFLPRLSGKESRLQCRDTGVVGWIPGGEYPLEKKMATHFSVLAWRIPGTEEPGGLPSMGTQQQQQGSLACCSPRGCIERLN